MSRRTVKNRGKKTHRRKRYSKKRGGETVEKTYVFVIPYRAGPRQEERRGQVEAAIKSIQEGFTKYGKQYKIIIVDQANTHPFNRGLLLNIGFLEGEKLDPRNKLYLDFNADYSIDSTVPFPKQLEEFDGNGVLDILTFSHQEIPRLGGASCMGSETFKKINGYPINIFGYGPDDIVIRSRIDKLKVPHIKNDALHKIWIKIKDESNRDDEGIPKNFDKLLNEDDMATNGVSACKYIIKGAGEFDNTANNIHHLLADFEFTQ